jgi:O-acetyl-ADP-ribose deacetylase (regulator of RNase III)
MGKGIALQFKQAFPENFQTYRVACKADEVKPGSMLVVATNLLQGPKYIINFPTKRHWRGKSRMDDVQSGLRSLVEEVRQRRITSVAIPPLGCGNGGLAWNEVRPAIEKAFSELPDVRVLLYEPSGAPRPDEMPVRTKRPRWTRARALFVGLMDMYRIPDYRLSLLEVQKLAYFLQVAGEPLRLRFVKHHYGPYADNLNHVLQVMEGHFIRGFGDRSREAEIRLLDGAPKEAHDVLQRHKEAAERLREVSDLIQGFETPYGMELLATVHWLTSHDPPARENVELTIQGIQEWSTEKRRRFKPEHIRRAWSHLATKGWMDRHIGGDSKDTI